MTRHGLWPCLYSYTQLICNTFSATHSLKYPFPWPIVMGHHWRQKKAVLTRMLEWQKEETMLETNLLVISAKGIDRGIIHGTILQHRDSTYGSMATDLLKRVCLCRGEDITWYNYQSPSIKDLERNLKKNSSLLDQIRPSAREARSYSRDIHPRNSSLDSSWRNGQ